MGSRDGSKGTSSENAAHAADSERAKHLSLGRKSDLGALRGTAGGGEETSNACREPEQRRLDEAPAQIARSSRTKPSPMKASRLQARRSRAVARGGAPS